MMKWGRKKASSTPSHPSLITHIFPISWLSKFKQKEDRSEPVNPISAKSKKERLHLASPSSSSLVRWREGRFYSGDDDSYWRLSFGEEADKPAVGLNSVGNNSDNDDLGVPVTSKSEVVEMAGKEVTWKFNGMVSDIRNSRNLQEKAGAPLENDAFRRKKISEETEVKTKAAKHLKLRKLERTTFEERKVERGPKEKEETTTKSAEKIIFEVCPERMTYTGGEFLESRATDSMKQPSFSFSNSNLGTIEEDCTLEANNSEESIAFSDMILM